MKDEYPIANTADGKPFSNGATYYFFDGERVRTAENLRRIDHENLGSLGSRIVAINKLRESRDAAIDDAQKELLTQIEALRLKVRSLENEKSPKARVHRSRI